METWLDALFRLLTKIFHRVVSTWAIQSSRTFNTSKVVGYIEKALRRQSSGIPQFQVFQKKRLQIPELFRGDLSKAQHILSSPLQPNSRQLLLRGRNRSVTARHDLQDHGLASHNCWASFPSTGLRGGIRFEGRARVGGAAEEVIIPLWRPLEKQSFVRNGTTAS